MPSTPGLQRRSSPHNGHSNGTSTAYSSKDQLVPPLGAPHASKALSPLHARYGGASQAGPRPKAPGLDEDVHGARASTSQLEGGARNGVKDEESGQGGGLAAAVQSLDHLFSICFRTSRRRAWEKSRKIEDVDLVQSKEELHAQLRPEEEGLVPLNAIAGRVVLYGWQLFANQVEINASLSPLKRRKRIYDDAHEARKQLIKLLVLTQWSKAAPELKIARSLIAFINDHFVQTDASVTSLAETRSILANARLRNYDLVTAIEVLGTGAPQRITPLIKDAIQAHNAYSDEEAVRLVKELEDAIRLRLACEEVLPMPMMSYSITDGRACFRVAGLFEADLTLSGSAIEDRWWLLRVKFDFKVTGVGVDRFPRQPKKNQRLQLLAMADSELAPRSVAAVPERSTAVVDDIGNDTVKPGSGPEERIEDVEMTESVALDEGEVLVRKDAPLVRLYNLLQSQALQYRLDILHYQALQQVKLSWGRRLSVRMEVGHSIRTLHIAYWHRPELDSVSDADEWRPTASASLAISVLEKAQECGTERVLKQLSTLAERDTSEHGRGQIPERLEVQVRWSMQRPANEYIDSTEVIINADDLNAEALLLDVTSRHGEAAVRAIKARIVSSSLGRLVVIQDCAQRSAKGFPEHHLLLNLSDKVAVALHIDQLSGQIRLVDAVASGDRRSSSSLAAHDWLKRLREASTRINERPDQIVPILHILRNKVVLEDLEEKSALLGIPVTTRMPLRQVDYAKLHAKPGTLLYIALVQCPGYYLVVHVGEETIRVALMCAGTFLEDLITSMRIVSLEWLDWQRVVALATSSSSTHLTLGKRKRGGEEIDGLVAISQESLSKLYSYSVALIYYHKIEEQLRASGLAFVHVGGSTALQGPPTLEDSTGDLVSAIIPSLCLDSRTFLDASNRTIINRNVSIRLNDWWDPAKAHVAFSLRLQLKEGLVTRHDILETAQQRINFDSETGVLDFFIRDIDNCLAVFLTIWKRMERMLELAREMLSGQASLIFTIDDFDFINVRFSYAKGMMGQVQWVQDLTERKGGHYDLKLEAAGGLSNPLRVLQPTLVAWLNHQDDSSPVFWRKFLEIWRQMLPILEHVHAFPDQCCDDADCPELIIQQPSRVRLVFLRKYMLDIQLVRDNKILFRDGVNDASACSSLAKVKDDFTLDDDETTATAETQAHGDSIPSLPLILSDLLAEYKLAQERASESDGAQANPLNILVFSNGFLCPNSPPTIDWFLPRLIKRIQDAVQ